MINAEEARRQTEDSVALEPILNDIEDDIRESVLKGRYETRINMPLKNLTKYVKFLKVLDMYVSLNVWRIMWGLVIKRM